MAKVSKAATDTIRVMIVDDSAFFRVALLKMLESEANLKVVAEAADGEEAMRLLPTLAPAPDLILMDVFMPRKDGLAALEQIVANFSIPVIMLSSTTAEGSAISVSALLRGAFDVIAKPQADTGLKGIRTELISKIRAATFSQRAFNSYSFGPNHLRTIATPPRFRDIEAGRPDRLVVIGASTGGPRALYELIPNLQPDVSAAFVVVQHMPAHLTADFAKRLAQVALMPVQEASEQALLQRSHIYIVPGDFHLGFSAEYRLSLNKGPKLNGVRPSLDVSLLSAVNLYGSKVLAVVMTGMGRDGLIGSGMVKRSGGRVLIEDESTCVVYGMPKEVLDAGYADASVPLPQLAEQINRFARP